MKKLFALLLTLALALGCCAALAETPAKTELGSINMNGAFKLQCSLPDNYTLNIVSKDDEGLLAVIEPQDASKPMLFLTIEFDEIYYDVKRMNDMTDEQLQQILDTFTSEGDEVTVSYRETCIRCKCEYRLRIVLLVVFDVAHAALFVAADEHTDAIAQRNMILDEVFARVHSRKQRSLVIPGAASYKISLFLEHLKRIPEPSFGYRNDVRMSDDAKELVFRSDMSVGHIAFTVADFFRSQLLSYFHELQFNLPDTFSVGSAFRRFGFHAVDGHEPSKITNQRFLIGSNKFFHTLHLSSSFFLLSCTVYNT